MNRYHTHIIFSHYSCGDSFEREREGERERERQTDRQTDRQKTKLYAQFL